MFLFDVVRLGVDCVGEGLAEVFQATQITKVCPSFVCLSVCLSVCVSDEFVL